MEVARELPVLLPEASLGQPVELEGALRCAAPELLALLALVPGWGACVAGDVTVRQLGGAMSNHIYRVEAREQAGSVADGAVPLLLRIYGSVDASETGVVSASLFSRADEVRVARTVARLRLGPRCFLTFRNGRLEEWLEGVPLRSAEMRTPQVSLQIAAALARFHALASPELAGEDGLWHRIRHWHALAARVQLPPDLAELVAAVPAAADALRASLQPWASSGRAGSATVFSHNDLQHNNILALTDGSVVLIDYEYAASAPIAYDIANHFCEMAADYAVDAPGGMLNYGERYPTLAQREAFCAAYLGAGSSSSDAAALARAAERYALASHLVWGLWGVVQAGCSSVEFDFMEYARQRFQEFHGGRMRLDPV